MSGNKFVLDTNTVLYLLSGDETLANFLFEKQLYISITTEMELLGYKSISIKDQKQIIQFINELFVVNISNEIKTTTIELKKNSSLKLPDSIIAATSIVLNIPFISSDKQFETIVNLDLVYYEK
jgi:predicted nucleic acid-binding protein